MNTQDFNIVPRWYTNPNDLMTADDIKEQLEYQKAQAELSYIDYVNAQLRVASLENSLGEDIC